MISVAHCTNTTDCSSETRGLQLAFQKLLRLQISHQFLIALTLSLWVWKNRCILFPKTFRKYIWKWKEMWKWNKSKFRFLTWEKKIPLFEWPFQIYTICIFHCPSQNSEKTFTRCQDYIIHLHVWKQIYSGIRVHLNYTGNTVKEP